MKLLSVIFVSLIAFFITACAGKSTLDNPSQQIINEHKSVIVYKSTSEIQCEFKGHPPEQTALELTKNGIKIIESNCGSISGMMNISVCGGGTSSVNIFNIDSKDLELAISLGFFSETSLNEGLSLEFNTCH